MRFEFLPRMQLLGSASLDPAATPAGSILYRIQDWIAARTGWSGVASLRPAAEPGEDWDGLEPLDMLSGWDGRRRR